MIKTLNPYSCSFVDLNFCVNMHKISTNLMNLNSHIIYLLRSDYDLGWREYLHHSSFL